MWPPACTFLERHAGVRLPGGRYTPLAASRPRCTLADAPTRLLLALAGVLAAACSTPNEPEMKAAGGVAPGAQLSVDDFACFDHTGKFQRFSRNADAKLVVLWAFAAECPIVRQYAEELGRLAKEFAPRGVRFLALDSAPQDDRAGVTAELAELGLDLPVLMDVTQCAAEMLEVTRTAEALVISTKDWRVLWRGPVDDRVGSGGQREAASRSLLRETLEAVLAGKAPPEGAAASDAPVKGCAITFVQPRAKHDVTYVRDVAPILARRCVPCHREGGIGPWTMNGYEKVRGWSAMSREVVLAQFMPPWHVDPEHGEFLEDMRLAPEEVRTLVHWVESGTPRGEGEDPLAGTATPIPEWPLGKPDLVIELPVQEIPATGLIPYRELPIELSQLLEDRWVRALDLRPSNAEVLHHAFAYIPGQQQLDTLVDELDELPDSWRQKAEAWLAENPDAKQLPPEYEKFMQRRAFQGRTYFAKYVPGQAPQTFPEGTGKLLPAKTELLFEFHYTSNGSATTDRPRLGIYFHDSPPEHELKVASTWSRKVALKPHERLQVSAERVFDHAFTLYALSPHMHYRGSSMRYTAVFPDGQREILLDVANYVFNWQLNYSLRTPRRFPAGTRIVCDAGYDNTAQNESNPDPNAAVRFGPRTEDEMFVGYIVYSKE